MDENKQSNVHANDELKLLYSVSVSDIAGFKQQQWNITNYGLLLYAAIVSIAKLLDDISKVEYAVLYALAFIIMVIGWLLITILHKSVMERRARLVRIRSYFSAEFRDCWRGGKSVEEVPDLVSRQDQKTSLVWFFNSIFGFSFIIASWILYKLSCSS